MEKFKISDIQEIFVSDVERFHTLTQHHVTQLLNEVSPPQESLDEALRQCHTLKGLAATVEAWGLSCLGADLETLLELAGSWLNTEREKANGIFEFILDHMQDWYVMNQFTCMDMLPQAWDIYQGLRGIMDERWPGYLTSPQSADGATAHYVRLTDLEIPDLPPQPAVPPAADTAASAEAPTPDLDVQGIEPLALTPPPGAPTPLRVVPPTLRSRDATSSAESDLPTPLPVAIEGLDVKQDAPLGIAASSGQGEETVATPKPLHVVPPTLRHRDPEAAPTSDDPLGPTVPASEASVGAGQPGAPKPLRVVPPSLRRKADHAAASEPVQPAAIETAAPVAPAAAESLVVPPPAVATTPAAPATPPILRVAPPALKRRAPAPEPVAAATEAIAPAQSVPTEPAGVDPLSAEAVFAALPETVETELVAPVASAAIAPTAGTQPAEQSKADADLLELLRQEVAGYLAELTSVLTALAANLREPGQWERARRLFHTIKGTAATFDLDAVSAPAKAAEGRCVAAVEAVAKADETFNAPGAFEECVDRAQGVAKALELPFEAESLQEAMRAAQASVANLAAATAATEGAPDAQPLDPEMAGFFIADTREQVENIERAVLAWEELGAGGSGRASGANPETRDPRPEMLECLQAAQRGFHTIKGAANSIGLTAVARSVHEVEAHLEGVAADLASGAKPAGREPRAPSQNKALFTFLLGAVDQLRQYLADLTRNTAALWRHDWSTALGLLRQTAGAAATDQMGAAAAAVVQAALVADVTDAAHDAESHTLRIEAARLYQLMNLMGEMVIDRARLARKIEQLTTLHRALAERNGALTAAVQSFQQQFEFNVLPRKNEQGNPPPATPNPQPATSNLQPSTHGEFSELEFDRYDQFNELARSLVEISHDIGELNVEVAGCLEGFAAENVQFAQTSQALQSRVSGLSLVPVKAMFPRLQRAFRDACVVAGKEAELEFQGGEAQLDKVVVDRIFGPLLHLLRNAVAHGIEDAATRERLNKPARGQVRLRARQLANQMEVEVADDGAGINATAVRERAVAKGWLASESPALTPEQVVHFIFQPGFSTASQVTSVSGRGVGLDVVRAEVEGLNGSVELRYEAGVGATWTLRLPLTLAISEAILARLGEVTLALPLNYIEYGVVLDAETLVRGEEGRETYVLAGSGAAAAADAPGKPDTSHFARDTVAGASLPVVRLSRLLGMAGDEQSNKGLIVGAGERRAVLVVDAVLARQEVVVKQLDSVLAQHALLNGATLDAEGRVIPILNVPALLKHAELERVREVRVSESVSGEAAPAPDSLTHNSTTHNLLRVLVVEDSLSVRKVLERQLRELGCEVTTATDGLHALEQLRLGGGRFDFVFTDLEMPRVNGYELITELRGNPAWAELPVVVISSRGAEKYITKAMNVGASTFLTKPFTVEQLREVLRHFGRVGAAA